MSAAAIQQVLSELKTLPESDQELVLGFLQTLKRKHIATPTAPARHGRNPALKEINGALVFTGEIGDPDIDWVKVVRDERDEEIIRQAVGCDGRP